jgi:hypothetical protein
MTSSSLLPAHLSTIASTPNLITAESELETTSDLQSRLRLSRQQAEAFIDRIMTHTYAIPKRIMKPRYAIPVRYPYETEIVRTAPENKLHATGWPMIADPATGEVYLISPYVLRRSDPKIWALCVSIGFALALSSAGASFLWPYPSGTNGDLLAETAVEEARNRWVRVVIDKALGDYRVDPQAGEFRKLSWPKLEHDDVIDIVFGDREIDSLDHPVHKRLVDSLDCSYRAITVAP